MQLILLILLGIDWASGYAIAGYCMTHGVNPYGYAFWQSFGPMVLLSLLQLILLKQFTLNRYILKYIVLSGISGIVVPNLLIYLAAGHVPSGLLTLLSNISPLLVYALAIFYREEQFNLIRSFFILVSFIGIMIIIGVGQQKFGVNLGGLWLLVALLIPLGYAFCAVYVSKFRPTRGNSLNYALGMLMVATIFNAPIVYMRNGFYPLQMNDFNSVLIALEILLSAIGYVLMFIIIRMVGAVYYTVVNTVTALTGVIYGYFIFGQRYPQSIYIAITMVIIALCGLTFTQRYQVKRNKPANQPS